MPPWALISRDPAAQARDAARCSGPGGGQRGDPRERVPGCSRTRAGQRASQRFGAGARRRGPDPDEQPAHSGTASAADTAGIRPHRPGSPQRSRTANCPGLRVPRRPAAQQPHCPGVSRCAPNCLPGRNWRRTHGRAVPRRRVLIHRFRRPPGRTSRPGREGGRPAEGASAGRVVPAAGLVPPQADSPEQPRRTENRPGYAWNTGAGVEPFRAAQSEPGPAPGGAHAGGGPPVGAAHAGVSPPGVSPSADSQPGVSPSAVSQPGVSPARRPSLALPRRLGSSMARQAADRCRRLRAAARIRSAEASPGRDRPVAVLRAQVRPTAALTVPVPAVPHPPARLGR